MAKDEIILQEDQTSPPALLRLAIEKGSQMDQLEKLMDLVERWENRQAKKKFLDALARFQTLVPVLKKNKTANVTMRTGGSYSYRYADLGSIVAQIKNALKDCGLSYRWEFKQENGLLRVTCFLSHVDGHTEATFMDASPDDSGGKNAIQQRGSTHTYLERYTLIGALGLATADEDNDGKGGAPAPQKQAQPVKPKLPTKEVPEYLEQWKDVVKEIPTRAALQALYLKNKKTVDSDPDIQAIFKARQEQLPKPTKTPLP